MNENYDDLKMNANADNIDDLVITNNEEFIDEDEAFEREQELKRQKQREEEEKNAAKFARFKGFKKAYNRAGLNVLIFFGIMQVLCSLFMIIGGVIYFIISGGLNLGLTDIIENLSSYLSQMTSDSRYIIVGAFYVIGYLITIILTIIFNKKLVYKDGYEETNIRKLSASEIFIVLLIAFGLWGIGVVIGNFSEIIFPDTDGGVSEIELIFSENYIFYILMAIFGAPFIEEVVCRKFFIDKTAKYGENIAVMLSALFFGLMHGNSAQFFLAFNLGLLMGVVYVKTKNILYTMLIHFTINFWASITDIIKLIFNFSPEKYEMLENAWEYVTYGLIIAGIVVGIIFIFVKKKELFIPKSNNEFNGKLAFKAAGIKVFFIISLVLTLVQDASSILSSLLAGEALEALVGLFPTLLFVFVIIFIPKYMNKKMVAHEFIE